MQNLNELDVLAEELTLRVVKKDGNTWYFNKNSELHRINGPAVIWANGDKFWCQHNKYHRLDGPATIYRFGARAWYIDDKEYTEAQFNAHPDVIAYAKSKQQ